MNCWGEVTKTLVLPMAVVKWIENHVHEIVSTISGVANANLVNHKKLETLVSILKIATNLGPSGIADSIIDGSGMRTDFGFFYKAGISESTRWGFEGSHGDREGPERADRGRWFPRRGGDM